jgi:uncharacterized membrane protein
MDERIERSDLLSALTTEHFVLQTANNSTYSEAAARSTLYVMALSSSLVGIGFVAGSTDLLIPFAAIVLPVVFLLGVFTVVRLVETALESMDCMQGIARIRGYYRSLGPEAALFFAAEHGRWPETEGSALRQGFVLACFGTTASMIAVINNAVAGAGITFLLRFLAPSTSYWVAGLSGIFTAVALTFLFYAYQRWRIEERSGTRPSD